MSLVVPNNAEVAILTYILTPNHTLRLFSNNHVPVAGDTVADYTEVSGGGYAAKALTFANWNITAGAPSYGQYNATQTFTFTGVTDPPGLAYGYYVTRDSDGKLMWAERFASVVTPPAPIAITPKFTGDSVY